MKTLIINRMPGFSPYRQIFGHFSGRIQRGELRPGDRLPTIREMVRTYSVSNGTMQKALQYLKSEGLIVGRQGDGLFVAEQVSAQDGVSSELWVEPAPWSEKERAAIKNRFQKKHPHIRVMEHMEGGDLRWLDGNFLPQHAASLEDVTDLVMELYGRSGENAHLFNPLRVNGRLFMLPLALNVQVMACNADVFERRGLPLPSPDWDWDEFLRTAEALTRASEGVSGCMINYHWDALLSVIWQAGGAVFRSDGKRVLLNETAAITAGRFLRACGLLSVPAGSPADFDLRRRIFITGKAGMMQVGVWGYQSLNEAKCRWVARPLPRGRVPATWWNARGYALVRRSARSAIARQFMREYAEYERWPENRLKLSGLPLHQELERTGETEATYRQALSTARSWLSDIEPMARRDVHRSALNVIIPAMKRLVHGPEPVEEVMDKIKAEMENLITVSDDGGTL